MLNDQLVKMKVIQHTAETLRTALVSSSRDLTEIYNKYTKEERHLLEEGIHPEQPDSLFHSITVHSDSDWIPAHPEEPQDFESFYRDCYRKIPSASHNTIYIQTIGSFGEVGAKTDQYVEWLRDYCQAFFYGLSVKLLPAVAVSETRCSFRVNSNSYNLQILTGDLLHFLRNRKPKDAFCIVGITMIDLYPKDSWNFVFGQASLNEGMGVFSFARYDDNFYSRNYAGRLKKRLQPKPGDYSVFEGYYTPPITSTLLLRSCKTMTHEIGHMFGIRHCQWLNCVMQGSNHLEESDRRPLDLCPICLRKLHVSVGFKIAERYKPPDHQETLVRLYRPLQGLILMLASRLTPFTLLSNQEDKHRIQPVTLGAEGLTALDGGGSESNFKSREGLCLSCCTPLSKTH